MEEGPHAVRRVRQLVGGRPLHDGEVSRLAGQPPVDRRRVAPADHVVGERPRKVFHEHQERDEPHGPGQSASGQSGPQRDQPEGGEQPDEEHGGEPDPQRDAHRAQGREDVVQPRVEAGPDRPAVQVHHRAERQQGEDQREQGEQRRPLPSAQGPLASGARPRPPGECQPHRAEDEQPDDGALEVGHLQPDAEDADAPPARRQEDADGDQRDSQGPPEQPPGGGDEPWEWRVGGAWWQDEREQREGEDGESGEESRKGVRPHELVQPVLVTGVHVRQDVGRAPGHVAQAPLEAHLRPGDQVRPGDGQERQGERDAADHERGERAPPPSSRAEQQDPHHQARQHQRQRDPEVHDRHHLAPEEDQRPDQVPDALPLEESGEGQERQRRRERELHGGEVVVPGPEWAEGEGDPPHPARQAAARQPAGQRSTRPSRPGPGTARRSRCRRGWDSGSPRRPARR